jgi:hypothetical protein
VVVTPSTGSAVGGCRDGANDAAGGSNDPGGRLAVMTKSVGVAESGEDTLKPQPEIRREAVVINKMVLNTF